MKVCFTGGGTGGHVFPGFAVDVQLAKMLATTQEPYERFWLGSTSEQERRWVRDHQMPHYAIRSGKLRRYASWSVVTDACNVIIGCVQALRILRRERPDVLFSKGGYVSVPPVVAARLLRIPSVTHESDAKPGLATLINARFVHRVCLPFEEAKDAYPKALQGKLVVTGVPTRMVRSRSDRDRAIRMFHLTDRRPVIVVLGGSQGALQINTLVWDALDDLLDLAQVVHQTGSLTYREIKREGYHALPFIHEGLEDLLSVASLVISRSGATALADFLEMQVPMILIPLGMHASRGDQIENAERLYQGGAAMMLSDAQIEPEQLVSVVRQLILNDSIRTGLVDRARGYATKDAGRVLAEIIMTISGKSVKEGVS